MKTHIAASVCSRELQAPVAICAGSSVFRRGSADTPEQSRFLQLPVVAAVDVDGVDGCPNVIIVASPQHPLCRMRVRPRSGCRTYRERVPIDVHFSSKVGGNKPRTPSSREALLAGLPVRVGVIVHCVAQAVVPGRVIRARRNRVNHQLGAFGTGLEKVGALHCRVHGSVHHLRGQPSIHLARFGFGEIVRKRLYRNVQVFPPTNVGQHKRRPLKSARYKGHAGIARHTDALAAAGGLDTVTARDPRELGHALVLYLCSRHNFARLARSSHNGVAVPKGTHEDGRPRVEGVLLTRSHARAKKLHIAVRFGPVVARTLGRDGARCGDIEAVFSGPVGDKSHGHVARGGGTGEIVQIAAGVTPQAPVPVQVGETGQVFAAQNLEYVPLAKRLGPYPGLFHQVDFVFIDVVVGVGERHGVGELSEPEIASALHENAFGVGQRRRGILRHGAVDVDPELSRFGLPRDGHVGPGFCGDGQSVL